LEDSNTLSDAQAGTPVANPAGSSRPWLSWHRIVVALYALSVAVSISVWFIAVRSPLWLDETGSYWQISAGFSNIWPRQFLSLSFPAYSYILWLSSRLIGSSEIALRIPSILAMLAAVYLLYRAARELFERDVAVIAVVVFCLDPIVFFASIDVRPYAFGVLATNAAILLVLRLRHSNSNLLAVLFGMSAAFIVYFHYLFAVILPALLICFFAAKVGDSKTKLRQAGIAIAVFAVAFLPTIPGISYLFHTSGTHVFEEPPKLRDLVLTLAPVWVLPIFVGVAFVALLLSATTKYRSAKVTRSPSWQILFCISLALIPILALYGVSVKTSVQLFIPRHRLVGVPGIALCWALVLHHFRSRHLRLLFCVALVAVTTGEYLTLPSLRQHGVTWKYPLELAQKNASVDNAPVLICSDFPEADHLPMPLDSPKESILFAPLSYYKLTPPVVPLPRALNDEAIRVGSQFLSHAAQQHQRFLAIAYKESSRTLDWLTQSASPSYTVRKLGEFEEIQVLEFVPRLEVNSPPARSAQM
jgi:hypothetical protein